MSVFFSISKTDYLIEGNYFFVIKDKYPVSPGHLLIITKTLKKDYFELSDIEKRDLLEIIDKAKLYLDKSYNPTGYNIGMNCGESAGQTIFHFHCHVIPRYSGDMENPAGGVRGVIPEKQRY